MHMYVCVFVRALVAIGYAISHQKVEALQTRCYFFFAFLLRIRKHTQYVVHRYEMINSGGRGWGQRGWRTSYKFAISCQSC